MNALTPQPQNSSVSNEILLSPRLSSLLNETGSSADAIAQIAANPVILTEAARALPMLLKAATAPAGEAGVKRVIGRRFALFPQPERSDGEWAEWWADYVDVVGHLPEGAIEAAMSAWIRSDDAEFMPKPGKLLALAKTTPSRSIRAYERAKAAMDYRPPAETRKLTPEEIADLTRPLIAKPRTEPTQADKERVRRQMREYIAQDDARKSAQAAARKANLPDSSGPATESGLSEAMKAKLAKDRAA